MTDSDDSIAADVFDFVRRFEGDREVGRSLPLSHYLAQFGADREADIAREYLLLVAESLPPDAPLDAPADDELDGDALVIGPYRVVRPLGEGGQGVVYLAEDLRIDRTVALKVLRPKAGLISTARIRRFNREATLISRLTHPGICGVYEADTDDGVPYIAMHYVEGETLAACIARARAAAAESDTRAGERITSSENGSSNRVPVPPRSPVDVRRVLRLIEGVARALHTAHEAGVIHRDVKPGNVMVTPGGAPVVLDFGLAFESITESATVTAAGEVWGTPAYMSPEQMRGPADALDRRTDVYSLGVVLFECLTLRRPFETDGVPERTPSVGRVPPAARDTNPAVPRDLDVVLAVALEETVDRRYRTALELAEDLRRICEYEPITARPASAALRLRRWTQRHQALAAAMVTVFAALVVGLVTTIVLLDRETEARLDAERARDATARALQALDGAHLAVLARQSVPTDPSLALLLAIKAAEREGEARTDFTDTALREACDAVRELPVGGHGTRSMLDESYDVDISPDDRLLLICSTSGSADSVALHTIGREEASVPLRGHGGAVSHARFSPDGNRVVTASADGTARIWDVDSGRCERVLAHETAVLFASFDGAGRRVVTVAADDRVRIFELAADEPPLVLVPAAPSLLLARFSADGRRVLAYGRDGAHLHPVHLASTSVVSVWDSSTGQLSASLPHAGPVTWAEFDPDGDRVLTADQTGVVRWWSTGGEVILSRATRDVVWCARLDPTGERVVIGSTPGTESAAIWDAKTFETVLALDGHEGRSVFYAAFSRDGARVLTAGWDDQVQIRNSVSGTTILALRGKRRFDTVAWSRSERLVAHAGQQAWTALWQTEPPPPHFRTLSPPGAGVVLATIRPDADAVLTLHADGAVWVRSLSGAAAATPRRLVESAATAVTFSADGGLIGVADETGGVALFETATGLQFGRRQDPEVGVIRALAVAPRGARLAVVGSDTPLVLWDVAAGSRSTIEVPDAESVTAVRFDPTGRVLAVGTDRGTVRLADGVRAACSVTMPEPPWSTRYGRFGVDLLEFAADGTALLCSGTCGTAVLWPVELGEGRLGRPRVLLRGYSIGAVALARDGGRAVVSYRFGGRVWAVDLRSSLAHPLRIPSHTNTVTGIGIHPDGRRYVSASLDGEAHVVDGTTGRRLSALRGSGDALLAAAFTADGESVVTVAGSGEVRLWPVDPLPEAIRRKPRDLTQDELVLVMPFQIEPR